MPVRSRAPLRFVWRFSLVGEPVPLSLSLPMLEHMGVKVIEELFYKVEPDGKLPVYVHDFGLSCLGNIQFDVAPSEKRVRRGVRTRLAG